MSVCVYSVCVLCVGVTLRLANPQSKASYRLCIQVDQETEKAVKVQRAVEP
jgi:hypothetical protein